MTTVCVAVAFITSQFGLIPVVTSRHSLAMGNQAFQQRDLERAGTEYRRAAEFDRLSVAPRQQIAELETYRLEDVRKSCRSLVDSNSGEHASEEHRNQLQSVVRRRLNEVRSTFDELILADRRSSFAYRRKAQGLTAVAEILGDQELLNEALSVQVFAFSRYPSSVETCVELVKLAETVSRSQSSEQDSAIELMVATARRALELDAINHSWGHSDRYLDQMTVSFLQGVVSKAELPDGTR